MSDVKIGQVWADNDKRGYGRQVRILRLTETHAIVGPVTGRNGRPGSGRTTRIRLDRFRPSSTGYRLVKDVEDGAQ